MRKAGSSITDDQLIDMLIALEDEYSGKQPEVKLSTAYNNLVEAVEEFNRIDSALIDAGVNPEALQGMQRLDTGELPGNVPGPYIDGRKARDKRIIVDYIDGPAGRELAPVMNTQGKPITITYGNRASSNPAYSFHRSAEEQVADVIQQVRGLNVIPNDYAYGVADQTVVDPATGVSKNIDVMMGFPEDRNTTIHTYTKLHPTDERGTDEEYRDRVQSLVESKGMKSPVAAVEQLIQDGKLRGGPPKYRSGKIVQANRNMVGSDAEVYDGLIIPGYTAKQLKQPVSQILTAPTNIRTADTHQLLKLLELGYFEPSQMRYGVNRGKNRNQERRIQQKVAVPNKAISGGKPIFEDVTKTAPLTQQLLDKAILKELYVRKPRGR